MKRALRRIGVSGCSRWRGSARLAGGSAGSPAQLRKPAVRGEGVARGVGGGWAGCGRGVSGGLDVSNMPSARDSPRAVSRSRSRDASSGGRPGTRASLVAAAVCSCTVASPKIRSNGPARHIHELHPSIRDDREATDQQAVAYQQILLTLGVPPGAHRPDDRDGPPAPPSSTHDGDGRARTASARSTPSRPPSPTSSTASATTASRISSTQIRSVEIGCQRTVSGQGSSGPGGNAADQAGTGGGAGCGSGGDGRRAGWGWAADRVAGHREWSAAARSPVEGRRSGHRQ